MIRVSVGTAGVLGLAHVPMAVAPTTAYLMVGGRCSMNCAFCAQARNSAASDLALSRVTWPEFPLADVCDCLRRAEEQASIGRCCIQVTAGKEYVRRAMRAVSAVGRATQLPLNVAILPTSLGQVTALVSAGVDRVGFGLDAACERVFRQVKGSHWARMLALLEETATRYPGHAAVHLIVGLGETEKELVARVLWARERGIDVGLFALTPIRGTRFADRSPPSLSQYRRMQTASRLILCHGARAEHFVFGDIGKEKDRLVGIALPQWRGFLADGTAFRTSGCPDCNRPYYNERPGGVMYNFPRPLTLAEARQAISEMEVDPSFERS